MIEPKSKFSMPEISVKNLAKFRLNYTQTQLLTSKSELAIKFEQSEPNPNFNSNMTYCLNLNLNKNFANSPTYLSRINLDN